MPCNGDCNQGRECNCECKYTFETYGSSQFWVEDWYTIEALEQLVKDLKSVKERQDNAMVKQMKESGVMR